MKSPNFGDELNKILWKNLFPDFEDKFQEKGLLGVGTLEGIKIPRKLKEIVFSIILVENTMAKKMNNY
jgi:hypothetical protein